MSSWQRARNHSKKGSVEGSSGECVAWDPSPSTLLPSNGSIERGSCPSKLGTLVVLGMNPLFRIVSQQKLIMTFCFIYAMVWTNDPTLMPASGLLSLLALLSAPRIWIPGQRRSTGSSGFVRWLVLTLYKVPIYADHQGLVCRVKLTNEDGKRVNIVDMCNMLLRIIVQIQDSLGTSVQGAEELLGVLIMCPSFSVCCSGWSLGVDSWSGPIVLVINNGLNGSTRGEAARWSASTRGGIVMLMTCLLTQRELSSKVRTSRQDQGPQHEKYDGV